MRGGAVRIALVALALLAGCAGVTPERRKEASARMQMGVSHLEQGNMPSAMIELRKAAELDPENPEVDLVLGMAYAQRGDRAAAEEYLREAIRKRPDYADAHNNLGILLGMRGRGDEAIREFETAAANVVYPTPEYAYHNMGSEYRRQGKDARAEEMYRKAIAVNGRYIPAHLGLAGVLMERGDRDGAIRALSQAREIAPRNFQVRMALGGAFESAGSREKALEVYRAVLSDTEDAAARAQAAERINLLTKER